MNDRQEGDRACNGTRLDAWWGFNRLQLAPGGTVDHVPPARVQLFAKGVRGFEIALSPALYALVEKALSFRPIRAFWL
jgi:hypothetical protein